MDLDPRLLGRENPVEREARLRRMPLGELVAELAATGRQLVRKELQLARAEARHDLRAEVQMAGGLGVAAVCALLAVQLLLVGVVLALMEGGLLPGWVSALVVAAVVLLVGSAAGLWGWRRRVRTPLETTRRSVRDNVGWAKEQVA
jgi:uncharacterized membrane protein YqjE